ncbi:MAG: EAL domain-containing protein [Roseateles sp.]|uniref:EAL domain-containing protein n=1 Tax=Roseateles sp. TaxID=1971397 RepID=UPI0040363B8E
MAGSNESLLQVLLDESADALLVVSQDQRVLYRNAAARHLLGRSAESGAVLGWEHPLVPGDRREVTLIDPIGGERTVESRVSTIEWGGESATLLVLRDLSERRAVEQALMLGRRVMEASVHGIVIADASDPRLPLIYANPAFERITGYGRGEALGRNCRFLQGGERDQAELQTLRQALARAEPVSVVLQNVRRDGTPFWNELSVSPVRNAAGEVTHFLGIQVDITERRRHEQEMLRRATHDALTGLPNRTLLIDRIHESLAAAARHGQVAAVLLIALDHFKELNDSLGHAVGDQLILEIVGRLQGSLREGDVLARLSGDTLMVLAPGLSSAHEAMPLADKLVREVSQLYAIAEQTLYCGCRIGVAVAQGSDTDAGQLIQQAGMAAHYARSFGRNSVHVYSGDLVQHVNDRFEIRARLQTAIAHREFELHYQPQMDLRRERISGVEALLRWNHPEQGQISPLRFIPIAEETGQIVAIGEWVMEQACSQHRRWLDAGLLDCPIAVNVSGVQFLGDGFVNMVAAVLKRTGLPPHRLELELTESVTMETDGNTHDMLHRLRALGVALSIDDFGTGFSSLGYLKRLPIDKIKIDRSFVKDITHDSDDAAIALGVIAMAHHLRLRVVAEGVETAAQLAFLKRHLCDEIQGYYLSRPLPANELESYLRNFRPPSADSAGEDVGWRPTLLLVDDEPNILRALTRALRRDGYRILTADGAAAAFDILAQNEVQVILSDQRMPMMCGTEFLSEVKSLYPQTVRMVLSGYTDLQSVTEAINRGAIYRFLTKPWEDEPLREHIKEAFQHYARQRAKAAKE